MKRKDFDLFMSQLSETNSTLDSFVDFKKVSRNVSKIIVKLTQLNYLLGKTKENLKSAVYELYDENPKTFDVLEILVAVRSSDNKKVLDGDCNVVPVKSYFTNVEAIYEFIECTGLIEMFTSREITNLVDYVYGVEVGLDTNARKNRGGNIMAMMVEKKLIDAGIEFRKEVNSSEFPEMMILGTDLKRFDFVVNADKTYLIETNYYNGGGSKLNETARSYSDIAPKINSVPAFEFVWITDGQGWHSARNKIEEAFSIIPRVYNLTSLTEFINELKGYNNK